MTREQADQILREWTKTEALLRHARSVELVMRALARRYGENEDQWGLAGLLHDADYEAFPDEHPNRIVGRLRELEEEELAYAISAHYTKWGHPQRSLMDKALLAADELTGFVGAASLVRPEGLTGMKPKSVIKKLKDKAFARKVDRDEIRIGAEQLGIELRELVELIIDTLREHKDELGLPG
ncbi:MAG: HD domain-containing protein [Acidobacteriota bacterium]|nr:MAG: HD domain-containing protein [Acidobacteriota bacterium]